MYHKKWHNFSLINLKLDHIYSIKGNLCYSLLQIFTDYYRPNFGKYVINGKFTKCSSRDITLNSDSN